MDTRDLGRISKMIGELIERLEEWERAGDRVADGTSDLIREVGKATRREEEAKKRMVEFQVGWSEVKEVFKAHLEETRRGLLDSLAEMIRREDC